MPADADPRTDLTESLHRSTVSYELAFAPVVMALLGLWLDKSVGTTPLFTILFAVVGLAGASIKAYYTYGRDMDRLRADLPGRRGAEDGRG